MTGRKKDATLASPYQLCEVALPLARSNVADMDPSAFAASSTSSFPGTGRISPDVLGGVGREAAARACSRAATRALSSVAGGGWALDGTGVR